MLFFRYQESSALHNLKRFYWFHVALNGTKAWWPLAKPRTKKRRTASALPHLTPVTYALPPRRIWAFYPCWCPVKSTLDTVTWVTFLKHSCDRVTSLPNTSRESPLPKEQNVNLLTWSTKPCLPSRPHVLSLASLGCHAPEVLKNIRYSPHLKGSEQTGPSSWNFLPSFHRCLGRSWKLSARPEDLPDHCPWELALVPHPLPLPLGSVNWPSCLYPQRLYFFY